MSTRGAYRRLQSHRSTLAGVGGIVLVAIGVVLTVAGIGGDVLPTVLAIVGLGSLLAGVASGALLVAENFRYRRDAPLYDPDEEDDD